jgi:hypothetical protein
MCRFKIVLPKTPHTIVTVTDRSARSAFDRAADAAERAVNRLLRRSKRVRRRIHASAT